MPTGLPSTPAKAASSPGNGITNTYKFELPMLAPLGSLTDGTNIPAPQPDPPEEQVVPATKYQASAAEGVRPSTTGNGTSTTANIVARSNGRDEVSLSPSTSPISPKRPSSSNIRRFLSHRSLRSMYSNASQENLAAPSSIEADASRRSVIGANDTASKKAAKRSSSWFGRFASGTLTDSQRGNKRASTVYEEKAVVKSAPPPPRLPELSQLKSKVEADMGAEDIFKNIK